MPFEKEKRKIRILALGLFRDQDRIFVSRGCDPATSTIFWRPPGGGINFGETSEQALKREIREELEQEIEILGPAILYENIFTYDNTPGHEIALVHEARFADHAMRAVGPITFTEPGGHGSTHVVQWVDLDEFRTGRAVLYPDGLLEYLDRR